MGKDIETKEGARWRYYIDREFQNRFMLRFALVIVIIFGITLGGLFLLSQKAYESSLLPGDGYSVLVGMKEITTTDEQGNEVEEAVPGEIFNAFQLYWPLIVVLSVVNLIVVTVFGLFYSHSMAGPVHNMKVNLQRMIDGEEVKPIRIRKGDQFQDLAALLNEFIEKKVK